MVRNWWLAVMLTVGSLVALDLSQAWARPTLVSTDEMRTVVGTHTQGECEEANCNTESTDCTDCGAECCMYSQVKNYRYCDAGPSQWTCYEELDEHNYYCCLEYYTGPEEGCVCPEGCPN